MFFYTNAVDISPAGAGANWAAAADIATGVPTGSTGVIVRVVNTGGTVYDFGIRKKGSIDAYTLAVQANSQLYMFMGVDAAGALNGFIENVAVDLYVVAYFGDEATFFTDSPSTYTSGAPWTEKDASGDCPAGSVAALFVMESSGSGSFGIRKTGSADNLIGARISQGVVVGLDASRHFDLYSVATDNLKIIGYLDAAAGIFLNTARVYDPAVSATYEDVDIDGWTPPANTVGVAIQNQFPTSKYYDYRKKGSTDTFYTGAYQAMLVGGAVGIDASGIFEAKVSDAVNTYVYIHGYFINVDVDLVVAECLHTHSADNAIVSPYLTVQDATHGHATDCFGRVAILLNGVMANETLHVHSTDTLAIYTPYARAEMILPMLECLGTVGVWGNADFDLNVPTLVAYGGGTVEVDFPLLEIEATGHWASQGDVDLTLPLLEVEVYGGGSLDLELPIFEVEGTGLLDPHGVAELTLTSLEIEAYGGGSLDIDLPGLEISATGIANIVGALSVDLPGLEIDAHGFIGILGSCVVNLPLPQVLGSAIISPRGVAEIDLVPLHLKGTGLNGVVGDSDIELTILSCVATGFDNIDGDLSIDFPALEMYLSMGAIHGRFDAYVLRYIRGELW